MQSPGHPSQVKSSQKKMHPSQTRAEEGLPRRADSPWLTGARQPPGAAGHGVVDVDCPVCLGVLRAGEGVVTFHILECGHRCAAPFLFPGAPFRQRGACRRCQCPPLPTSPPPPPQALSRWVCYTGSTKTAGSRSKRGGPRPAPCAGARSVAARRAPRARLRSRATWPDAAPQLHLPAPVVAELEGRARAAPPMSISLGAIYSMPG